MGFINSVKKLEADYGNQGFEPNSMILRFQWRSRPSAARPSLIGSSLRLNSSSSRSSSFGWQANWCRKWIYLKLKVEKLATEYCPRAHKHTDSDKDMAVDVDALTLLLRCCVSLSMVDSSLVMENTQFLLSVLGKLIALVTSGCSEKESVSFWKSISCECTYTDAGGTYVSEDFVASLCFLQPSNLWHLVLCAFLETNF